MSTTCATTFCSKRRETSSESLGNPKAIKTREFSLEGQMEIIPVSVRLTTGALQTIVLNKQLSQVTAVDLVEVLAVGWNAGVSAAAILKIVHPQLHVCGITGANQTGTALLVDVLNPHQTHHRRVSTGEIATVNQFQISISDSANLPMTFTELHLVFHFHCKAELTTAQGRLGNALTPFPLMNSAQPGQTRFNN